MLRRIVWIAVVSAVVAAKSSSNNGLNGLLLGKDRELFHVAIDLKWFFKKLTDVKGWGKMILKISNLMQQEKKFLLLERVEWCHL